MNKKIFALAAGSMLFSSIAFADCGSCGQFYFGGDLGWNKLGYFTSLKNTVSTNNATLKSNVPSLGLLGGVYLDQYWGVEAGYQFNKKAKYQTATTDGGLKLGNAHVDVLGYLPVERNTDVVGSIGVGRARVTEVNDILANGVPNQAYNKFGYRVGAGVQYHIDSNFTARAMLGYQKVGSNNSIEFIKRATSLRVGLTYSL